MTTITAADVLRVTREIVAEDPDRTNNGECQYARLGDDDGLAPNCIAAAVLTRLGMSIEFLASYEGYGIQEIPYPTWYPINDDALDLLGLLQRRADNERNYDGSDLPVGEVPWSDVLDHSTNYITDLGLA